MVYGGRLPGRFLSPARYNLLELLGLGALGALGISKAHIVSIGE